MEESYPNLNAALVGLDETKRATLKRLIGTGAFIRPIVVSFVMADSSINAFMHAASAYNTTPDSTTTTSGPTTATPPPGHPAKS